MQRRLLLRPHFECEKEVEMKTISKFFLFAALVCIGFPAAADKPAGAGVQRTEVVINDDWQAENPIAEGTLTCPGGEVEWLNKVTPYCTATGLLHWRNAVLWGCTHSSDERVSGPALFEVNANLDANYSGHVWGTWKIVKSDTCDLATLLHPDPDAYWKGTWNGERIYTDAGMPTWIGELRVVGKAYGGEIDGFHIKGVETIKTFTPLPVPWEFIPGLPSGPEGILKATIKE